MKTKHTNNHGVSMILVIAALLVTGFIGAGLLKMGTSDRLGGIYFSSSQSARSAAKSGLTAAITRIGSSNQATKDSIVAILNTYAKAADPDTISNYKILWICGGPNSAPVDSQWKSLSPGSVEKFRVRIDAFNKTTFDMTLVSEGIGIGKSRSTAIALYNLKNLGFSGTAANVPTNALQMDNGNLEFSCKFTVNGNVSVFDKINLLSIGPAMFNGRVRIDPHRTTGAIGTTEFSCPVTITDNAYFAGPVVLSSQLTAMKNLGFEKKMTTRSTSLVMNGNSLYLNDGVYLDGGTPMDLGGTRLYGFDGAPYQALENTLTIPTFFSNYSGGAVSTRTADIPSKVIVPAKSPKITFDYKTVLKHPNKWTIGSELYLVPFRMNEKYEYQKAHGELYKNKFLVIHFPETYSISDNMPIRKSGGIYPEEKFKGKAIIIFESSRWEEVSFDTEDTANVAIYVHKHNSLVAAFLKMYKFRGFIYVNETEALYTAFASDGHSLYRGSIYAGEKAKTKFESGESAAHHEISFDQGVVDELNAAGVFNDPTSTSVGTEIKITSGSRILPRVLGQAM